MKKQNEKVSAKVQEQTIQGQMSAEQDSANVQKQLYDLSGIKFAKIVNTVKATYRVGVDDFPAKLILVQKLLGIDEDKNPIWSESSYVGYTLLDDEIIEFLANKAEATGVFK